MEYGIGATYNKRTGYFNSAEARGSSCVNPNNITAIGISVGGAVANDKQREIICSLVVFANYQLTRPGGNG